MAALKTIFVLALIAVSYVVVAEDVEAKGSHDDEYKWKYGSAKWKADQAADTLRNVTIKTHVCEVQLASMANNFLQAIDYGVYSLNTVIPNLVDEPATRKVLIKTTVELNVLVNDLQLKLHGDSNVLKEQLILCLKGLKQGMIDFAAHIKIPNPFACNRIRATLDVIIYAMYRLKSQANHFDTPDKELDGRLTRARTELLATLKALTATDKRTEDELRHSIVLFSIVTERAVNKLQNWIEINSKDAKNVELVTDVSKALSEAFDKLNRLALGQNTVEYLKAQLGTIYDNLAKEVQKLDQIELADNLGGQEFIRSVLFDFIAVSATFRDNFKNYNKV